MPRSSNSVWNIMVREDSEPHFRPFWRIGIDETTARDVYHSMLNDPVYTFEMQLVNDYKYHYDTTTVRRFGQPREVRKHVVDGWKGVLSNAKRPPH